MAGFRIVALDDSAFAPLFALDDGELRQHGAVRVIADDDFGYPCRVSLEDARAGEELLLLPYVHHATGTPYRASGPIYVRRGAVRRQCLPGEVPDSVARRLMSLRAYDADGMMQQATVVEGAEVAATLTSVLADDAIAYVHLHNAKPGCYSCLAVRP